MMIVSHSGDGKLPCHIGDTDEEPTAELLAREAQNGRRFLSAWLVEIREHRLVFLFRTVEDRRRHAAEHPHIRWVSGIETNRAA